MKRLLFLLLFACHAAASSFDEAALMTRDLGHARELYRKAAATDPDPKQRDRAVVRAAHIDWYVFHDATAARTMLARIAGDSSEAAAASIELAQLETELTGDFAAARAAAKRAETLAKTRDGREEARIRHVAATVEESRRKRLAGTCPDDGAVLRTAIADLGSIIETSGPLIETSRLLLDAALMVRDEATALQALRWYFSDAPNLVPATVSGVSLASAKLFEEAELVLRDPCAPAPAATETRDLLTYAASLRRVRTLAQEHHRAAARNESDDGAFQKAVEAEARSLWNALSWKGTPPKFSLETASAELERRFGTVVKLGKTNGVFDMVLGHRIRNEERTVEQYGHRAKIRFVQLDGMIAGGYLSWLTNGSNGTGGWSGDGEIVQIRPIYADSPVRLWRLIDDPELRAGRDEETAAETRRDEARAKEHALGYFRGLDLRLQKQYREQLREMSLSRDAFIERVHRDKFESSIWAHEGRHAIDKTVFGIKKSEELEFRAKLSEVAFAPSPRSALRSILSPIGGNTGHGQANERALKGVEQWMRAHSKEVAGLDVTKPLLPQMDLFSDEQLREAFRSQDPLAKQQSPLPAEQGEGLQK